MRKNILVLVSSLLISLSVQAECTFESFAIGEEFSIGNMLVWTTSEEIDNKLFIIEKSTNGDAYGIVGEVAGSGSIDEETSYRFMDLDARKGTSFYRIKQIDFDGSFSYSHTVIVNKSTENNFMITSINNPLNSEKVSLTIDIIEDMELTLLIKDMKGDVLQEDALATVAGLQNVEFDLSSYPNGSYKLYLESGSEVEVITIRKTLSAEDSKIPVAAKN